MKHISRCVSLLPAGFFLLRLPPALGFVSQTHLSSRHSSPLAHPTRDRYSTPFFLSVPSNRSRRISVATSVSIRHPPAHIDNMPLSYALLAEQNANTTNAIIQHFATSPSFVSLSESEGSLILRRDEEDGQKLQKGIDIAKSKGVIDPNFVAEEYISVDVLGKSPEEVADEILARVRARGGDGGVVVLCGLSGTGKGTTVAKLQEKLESQDGKRVVTWSNGNIFRSVTLLAATWCEQQSDIEGFDPEKALTKENLSDFMKMLTFGKFNDRFDTRIRGLGLDLLVSEVQNTELKAPKVAKNIPTVAEVTQGEVILFAADAIQQMGADGIFVLLEGREQTVNYVRTPLRFTLTMSDMTLIGKRRAAQRLAAGALGMVGLDATEEDIGRALEEQLEIMVKEHS